MVNCQLAFVYFAVSKLVSPCCDAANNLVTSTMLTMTDEQHCVTFDDVLLAAERIKGVAHRTPVLTSRSLIVSPGQQFFYKVEAMQKTGSFKFRGALNAVKAELESHGESRGKSLSVVTHSSGNFAQALALAAQSSQLPATIVMPRGAPDVKKQAVADFGANIVLVDNTNEARQEGADKIVSSTGASFIHPSEDPRVIAGQGTAGIEFVEQVKELGGTKLDAVIVPVGGGGLSSGNAISLRALLGESVKIILAEPANLDDAKRSFTEKRLLKHLPGNKLDSVADGLKTTLGPNTWPIIRDLVDDIFTVTEDEILRATKLVWERLKVCIEPSSGVAVAVAMGQEFKSKYSSQDGIHNVGIILSGGNVDIIKIAKLMDQL